MTVAQELTPMTPEVQSALLRAEGERWYGMQGTRHGTIEPKNTHNYSKKNGIKHGRFTYNQRVVLERLREHGETQAQFFKDKHKFFVYAVAKALIEHGYVTKETRGKLSYYRCTEKGRKVEIVKTGYEAALDMMRELGTFTTQDVIARLPESTSYSRVDDAKNRALAKYLIRLKQGGRVKVWEWVG